MTVALYAEFAANQNSEQSVVELVRQLTDQVRREDGNLVFQPHVRGDDPRQWFVYELYRDRDAFERHLAQPHTEEFNRAIANHIAGGVTRLSMLAAPWAE